jgi:hypothetical protein
MRIQTALGLESRKIKAFAYVVTLAVLLLLDRALVASQKQTVIVVDRPTVVAFFPPVTDAEMDKDPDTNEALSDFQLYARQARKRLEAAGIQFQEIYVTSFAIQVHGKTKVFRPEKIQVGYYFVAPDKPPRIQYGVMTDADILRVATEYFHLPSKP